MCCFHLQPLCWALNLVMIRQLLNLLCGLTYITLMTTTHLACIWETATSPTRIPLFAADCLDYRAHLSAADSNLMDDSRTRQYSAGERFEHACMRWSNVRGRVIRSESAHLDLLLAQCDNEYSDGWWLATMIVGDALRLLFIDAWRKTCNYSQSIVEKSMLVRLFPRILETAKRITSICSIELQYLNGVSAKSWAMVLCECFEVYVFLALAWAIQYSSLPLTWTSVDVLKGFASSRLLVSSSLVKGLARIRTASFGWWFFLVGRRCGLVIYIGTPMNTIVFGISGSYFVSWSKV